MKKTLFVLFLLLFILIITCVYQKTYTIYSQQTTIENNVSQPVVEVKSLSHINTKNEVVTTKKEPIQEATLLERIQSSVMSVMTSDEDENKTKAVNKLSNTQTNDSVATTNDAQPLGKEEQEIVDYLISVLKERDLAIAERDKVEAQLQDIINKALEERRLAIDNMHSEVDRLEKEKKILLEERDLTAKLLETKHTNEEGK